MRTMKIGRYILKLCDYVMWNLRLPAFGLRSRIVSPYKIKGNIRIGRNVMVKTGGWIETAPLTGRTPEIEIGDNCDIGRYVEIFATSGVRIRHDVLFGERVYVADNAHHYEDIRKPVHSQGVRQLKEVEIGEGSWIGSGVCVIGASIGRHCVIGANSIVNKDIPDYCVAAGSPAKIIKRYDPSEGRWIRV